MDILEKQMSGDIKEDALWDIVSDFKFFNFPLLLLLLEKSDVKDENLIQLIKLMASSGYNEFLKTNIKLPLVKQADIIQKLIILDLLDLTESCQGQVSFATLKEITRSNSTESLMEFLIFVLTIGVLKGKINTRECILLVSDVIPRNYSNVKDLGDKINEISTKVNDSIQMLSMQIDVIDSKQKEWEKEEKQVQAQMKKISDKVRRSHKPRALASG